MIPTTTVSLSNRLSLPNIDHIQQLKREVDKLKKELIHTQDSHRQKMDELVKEEQDIRNENLRLQRKLQLEVWHCFFFFEIQLKNKSRIEN